MRPFAGFLLAPFWLRFGIRVPRKSKKRCVLGIFEYFQALWFRCLSQTHCILHPFWQLSGSCSRLAAYVFHGLRGPNLHENTIIYMLFDYFLAPWIPLENLLTNHSLISKTTKTLYFTICLTTCGLLESSSNLCVSRTSRTQPSRTHCNLDAFWLLSGPVNSSRNSTDQPFAYQWNHENAIF